ncbi:unnamed protein product [Rhizophagus irregularis]|nr:unnamed protein product [Rhizophagus irregularis]
MDNAKCHDCDNISNLSNIKIYFLPPNTTSHLQPLDQGIIYSLKAQYRKLLCKNQIQAYDLYEDQTPPPVDILDSINLIAEAWKIVTKKTIINSWAKAEILPDDESNTSDGDDSEVEDDIEDLQLLINELPITDLLNMEEYINIDDELITEEELTLEEIVNMVRGQNTAEEHVEEKEDETIITSDALNSIEKLIRYVQQNDLSIDNSDMQNLFKLKKKIISDSKKKQKQDRIDGFF